MESPRTGSPEASHLPYSSRRRRSGKRPSESVRHPLFRQDGLDRPVAAATGAGGRQAGQAHSSGRRRTAGPCRSTSVAKRARAPRRRARGSRPAVAHPSARRTFRRGSAPGDPARRRRVAPSPSIVPSPAVVSSPLSCRAAGGLVPIFSRERSGDDRRPVEAIGPACHGSSGHNSLASEESGASSITAGRPMRPGGEYESTRGESIDGGDRRILGIARLRPGDRDGEHPGRHRVRAPGDPREGQFTERHRDPRRPGW